MRRAWAAPASSWTRRRAASRAASSGGLDGDGSRRCISAGVGGVVVGESRGGHALDARGYRWVLLAVPLGSLPCHVAADRRLHRHRPPDDASGASSPTPWSSSSWTRSRCPSWSTTSRSAAAASRPTCASASASSACGRCSSARPARTSPTTAPGSSGTASTAPTCASPRPGTPPGSSAPPTRPARRSRRSTPAR